MGCGVSRLDGNGIVFPARLRPRFLERLEDIAARRHKRPVNDPNTTIRSTKKLLAYGRYEDDDSQDYSSIGSKTAPVSREHSLNRDQKLENPKAKEILDQNGNVIESKEVGKEETLKGKGKNDGKGSLVEDEKAKIDEVFVDAQDDVDYEDEDSDERMIGHEDDHFYAASPSFRIYFTGDGEEEDSEDDHSDTFKNVSLEDAIPCDDSSSKDSSEVKKIIKKGRRRRSFRKVLPKGGQAVVKNLLNLNMKSCYIPCQPSQDRTHLLSAKTNA